MYFDKSKFKTWAKLEKSLFINLFGYSVGNPNSKLGLIDSDGHILGIFKVNNIKKTLKLKIPIIIKSGQQYFISLIK